MVELPGGVVTFLLTDVQGSTRAWEESPDLMMGALDQHNVAIEGAIALHNGVSVKPRGEGDSRFIVFASAIDAVAGAAEMQRRLATVEQDLDNIRSAWRHLLNTDNADGARKFVFGLFALYELRGWYPAGVSLVDEALELLDPDSDDEATIVVWAMSAALRVWCVTLLGQPEAVAALAAAATAALRNVNDPVHLWLALQCEACCLAYLGRVEEMIAVTDEGIALGEDNEEPFWVAGMKNWRSFAAVRGGDDGTAAGLLPEAMDVMTQHDEHYFMTWTLWLQALIATHEDRFDDAIALLRLQVARAQEVDYLRGMTVGLEALGEAYAAANQLEAAERAFIESLATAEQMGMVRDMLGTMTKIAGVRAELGRPLDAVEMLAMVCAEPISAQQPFTAATPIRDTASEALEQLRGQLDPQDYEAAHIRGAATAFDVAAKVLIDRLKSGEWLVPIRA